MKLSENAKLVLAKLYMKTSLTGCNYQEELNELDFIVSTNENNEQELDITSNIVFAVTNEMLEELSLE